MTEVSIEDGSHRANPPPSLRNHPLTSAFSQHRRCLFDAASVVRRRAGQVVLDGRLGVVEQQAITRDHPTDGRLPVGSRARGLDYPLASLAARPPCLFRRPGGQHQLAGRAASASERSVETTPYDERLPVGSPHVVSTIRSLRSLLDHLVVSAAGRPAPTGWSSSERQRAISRDHADDVRLPVDSPRGLDYPLASLAARPPCLSASGGQHQLAGRVSERQRAIVDSAVRRPRELDSPRVVAQRAPASVSPRSLLDHLVRMGSRPARPPVPSYARARCKATMPPERLRHSVDVQPAWPIRVARPRWSGQARMDSAR